jgi:protoporphyrinogen oxidase
LPVTVLEAAPHIGGNARTLTHGPFRFDTGAHRFHDRHPEITADVKALLGADLVEVSAPSQIRWGGGFIDFPLTPVNLLQALGPVRSLTAARDLAMGRLRPLSGTPNFEEVAVRAYGRSIADMFLLGYSRKLWGVACERLSPAVAGRRLQGLSLRLLARELLRASSRSAHLEGRFYYPTDGIGMIADRLGDQIGRSRVTVNSRITRIEHDGRRVVGIAVNGQQRHAVRDMNVVCTLPPAVALGLLSPAPPADVLAAARTLRFRQVVLVTLFVNGRAISPNATIYFPEPRYPFTRASEPRNRSPRLSPEGKTSLSIEIPCWNSDEIWTDADASLIARCKADMVDAGLVRNEDLAGGVVHRIPNAYPVLELGVEARLAVVRRHLERFENLHLMGRAGLFAYVHLHDLLESGREMAAMLARPA